MKAQFSLTDIESIKRELLRLLPNVKSSHRVEAIARGLGWNSNAALRADLLIDEAEREIDDTVFAAYLNTHGFSAAGFGALGEAVVCCKFAAERAAIKLAMDIEPSLARWGFGMIESPAQTREQRKIEFQQAREEMLTAQGVAEFIRARYFLSHFRRRASINRRVSSYGLKHQAEGFHRDLGLADVYVGNGMLIAAAIHLGFKVMRTGINACLNIGARQDHPIPNHGPASLSPVLSERALPAGGKTRLRAWRNVMIAAINAGLDQKQFGLDPDDNRWTGDRGVYHLAISGMPAIASVGDAGFGELAIKVAVKPRSDAEEFIKPFTGPDEPFRAGEAFASGWLERRKGKWLQTSSRPLCYFRRDLLPILGAPEIRANGYLPEGRVML